MCELFALSSQLPTRVTFSLEEFSQHGASTGKLADGWGLAFYAFAHQRTQDNGHMEAPGMYYQERHCDCDPDALQDSGVQIHNMAQDLVLFASVPLSKEGWHACAASQLIVVKHGRIVATRKLQ